ncbi:MAG TPA: sulfite exporter TauE/SafE family protein [Sphingomonas sp.]
MVEVSLASIEAILPFIAIGFAAQLVDGALGMAFGLINSTLLISVMGLPPRVASASVHAVETFTTAASGISHVLHRNVNWRLFARLVIPGMIGGVLGAYVLSNIDASVARPFVMTYLAAIGLYLLWRAWRGRVEPKTPRIIEPLGLVGGFLDAAGGGGWGPVVTSNLLVQGASPRETIGTVNTVEFFLTATISATFIWQMGFAAFTLQTLGLLIGGLLAAPLGGVLAKRVPARPLMAMVGVLLTLTSAFSIYQALADLVRADPSHLNPTPAKAGAQSQQILNDGRPSP